MRPIRFKYDTSNGITYQPKNYDTTIFTASRGKGRQGAQEFCAKKGAWSTQVF
jgi:hypothetical protein